MSYTRKQWCLDFLAGLGNHAPSATVLDFVSGWTSEETPRETATSITTSNYYNLLNTTYVLPGQKANNYNSVGVQRFASYKDGIAANVETITNPHYPTLLAALRNNLDNVLNPPSSAILANLHTWCGACNYGRQFVSEGPSHLADLAPEAPGVTTPAGGLGATGGSSTSTTEGLGVSIPGVTGLEQLIATVQAALNPVRWAKGILGLILITDGLIVTALIFFKQIAVPAAQQAQQVTQAVTDPLGTRALTLARNAYRAPRTVVTPVPQASTRTSIPPAPRPAGLPGPAQQDMPTVPMTALPQPPEPNVIEPGPAVTPNAPKPPVSESEQPLETETERVSRLLEDIGRARRGIIAEAREARANGDETRYTELRGQLRELAFQRIRLRQRQQDLRLTPREREAIARLKAQADELRALGIIKPPSEGKQP